MSWIKEWIINFVGDQKCWVIILQFYRNVQSLIANKHPKYTSLYLLVLGNVCSSGLFEIRDIVWNVLQKKSVSVSFQPQKEIMVKMDLNYARIYKVLLSF